MDNGEKMEEKGKVGNEWVVRHLRGILSFYLSTLFYINSSF